MLETWPWWVFVHYFFFEYRQTSFYNFFHLVVFCQKSLSARLTQFYIYYQRKLLALSSFLFLHYSWSPFSLSLILFSLCPPLFTSFFRSSSTFVPSFGPYLRWLCKLCSKSINNFLNVNFQLKKLSRICSLALIGNFFVFRKVCDSYFTSSSCRFTVPSISVSCPFLDEALRLFPALMCLLSHFFTCPFQTFWRSIPWKIQLAVSMN